MTGTKFWTGSIAVGIVLSLLVAAAHFSGRESGRDTNRNARLARLQVLLDEGKTEYRASVFRKKIRSTIERVAGERVAGLEDGHTVTAVPALKAKDDKKVAKKDEKKKKDDKKDKKKKKKKKKKVKGAGEKEETSPEESADDEAADDATDEVAANNGAAGNNSPAFTGGVNNNPQSVDEWFAYLSANLDYEHVSKFIQLAQAGEVTSETFFGTIEKMLSTENTRMHQFAVLALGSTPSQTSFTLLADVAHETTMAQKVRSQSTEYMKMYTRLEYVGYLGGVVGSGTEIVASITALQYIENAANLHLKNVTSTNSSSTTPNPTGTTGSTGEETTTTTRAPASNVTRTFETIASSLSKAAGSHNSQLSSMSAQTLQLLRTLLQS